MNRLAVIKNQKQMATFAGGNFQRNGTGTMADLKVGTAVQVFGQINPQPRPNQ